MINGRTGRWNDDHKKSGSRDNVYEIDDNSYHEEKMLLLLKLEYRPVT
jgi:hypothetical protein